MDAPASHVVPPLREISVNSIPAEPAPPSNKIRFDEDVQAWKRTRGYRDYAVFLRRLDAAVTGVLLPWNGPEPSAAVNGVLRLLDELNGWIDDIPPQPTPQRFGNLAFRVWGKRLEDRAHELLEHLLPPSHRRLVPLLQPYLITAFGSFVRMDYGTGHEASFALLLLCLTLVRFLQPERDEERHMVFTVFACYLSLCWRLQDVYRLEPAGSHGVWGLDDSHFLPFIFGSAQLKGGSIPVDEVLRPPLPASNLYFMSIMRIHQVKTGPFHEHSSQLHAIATGVPHWGKVNQGLLKMYDAEVLGKRVVVQHIPLGGLLEWDVSTAALTAQTGDAGLPQYSARPSPAAATAAPWASIDSTAPVRTAGTTAAPWAQTGTAAPWAQTNTAAPWLPPATTAAPRASTRTSATLPTRRPAGSSG